MIFQLNFLLSILMSTVICIGLGGLTLLSKQFQNKTFSLGVLGAIGILILGSLSLAVNFFLPLDAIFFSILALFSLLGYVTIRKHCLNPAIKKEALVLFIVIVFYWLLGLRRVVISDAGLYHIPLIQWMVTSSLPVGLANVHNRFAGWNFWFSVCGGISSGNVLAHAVYGMNIVAVGLAGVDFFRWIKTKTSFAHYFSIAALFLISFLDTWYFTGGHKSPNADFAGAIFAIWAFSYFLTRSDESEDWILPTIILSGLAILTKLNQAPLFLLILFALRYGYKKAPRFIPTVSLVMITVAAFLMVLKTFWTSGCLLFPVAKTCFVLPWSMDLSEVIGTYKYTLWWARWPGGPEETVLHTWGWLPVWWAGYRVVKIIVCMEWIVGIFLFAKVIFKNKIPKIDLSALGIAVLGLVYWFVSAPDIRFGFGYMVVVFSILFGALLQFVLEQEKFIALKRWLLGAMVLALSVSVVGQVRKADDFGRNTLIEPKPTFQVMKNEVGQSVYVPENAECWRLPTPCTPYFDPKMIQSQYGLWTFFEKRRSP